MKNYVGSFLTLHALRCYFYNEILGNLSQTVLCMCVRETSVGKGRGGRLNRANEKQSDACLGPRPSSVITQQPRKGGAMSAHSSPNVSVP